MSPSLLRGGVFLTTIPDPAPIAILLALPHRDIASMSDAAATGICRSQRPVVTTKRPNSLASVGYQISRYPERAQALAWAVSISAGPRRGPDQDAGRCAARGEASPAEICANRRERAKVSTAKGMAFSAIVRAWIGAGGSTFAQMG